MEDSASASNPNQLQLGQRTEKNIGRQTLKGTVYILFMEGPRNRLQLRNTVYFKRVLFFRSLWALRSILWCHGPVQNGPPATVTVRLEDR